MASEITVNATLEYDDGVTDDALQVADAVFSAAVPKPHRVKQLIPITEVAVNLGGIAAPGYALFRNLNPTNYVDLKVASSGAIFARLDPDTDSDGKGGVALLKLGAGAQIPYAIANTDSCYIEVLICG